MEEIPKYAVHNEKVVKGFFGGFRFLSNFWVCPNGVWFEGERYLAAENAYQAAKVQTQFRKCFTTVSPSISKKDWKKFPLLYSVEAWDLVRYDVMATIVFDKFCRNVELRKQLLETGSKYLEETNTWKDYFWGADPTFGGKNKLGKILMKTRSFWNPNSVETLEYLMT